MDKDETEAKTKFSDDYAKEIIWRFNVFQIQKIYNVKPLLNYVWDFFQTQNNQMAQNK